MKYLFTVLVLLSLTACNGGTVTADHLAVHALELPTPTALPDSSFLYRNTNVSFVGKRLYLFHGLNGSHTDMLAVPSTAAFVMQLLDAGWEVVTTDLPPDDPNAWSDGGTAYRQFFVGRINSMLTSAGPCSVNVIAGISFGGYKVLSALPDVASSFKGYLVLIPLIQIDHLSEFASVTATDFNPQNGLATLSKFPAFYVWSKNDKRVQGSDTDFFVELLKGYYAPIQTQEYLTKLHQVPADISYLDAWLLANF